MPLVRQSIPALYGGVSQQAASVRSPTQCEAAVNCLFTVADGASKRPPLELVAPLFDLPVTFFDPDPEPDDSLAALSWSYIPYPNTKGFVLFIDGVGGYKMLKVEDGALITALDDTAQAYLTRTDMLRSVADTYATVTVGRTTYIANRSILVEMLAGTAAGTLSGTAQTLQDTALGSASSGDIWKILGDESNQYDTYYAKKVGSSWVEWVAPGTVDTLDPATMPHKIEIIEDDVEPLGYRAEFSPVSWAQLLVGDVKSNKLPSIVGARINGIFFAHDRLGLLADNGVTMSETGEYGSLFRTTVTDVLDSDRIDVKVASDGSATLNFARPLGKSIILFADSREFSLDGQPIFSPRTVSATQATAYPSSRVCSPVTSGPNIYFASDTVNATQVWEMYVQDDSVTSDATNITAHVPSYIDGELSQLAVNNSFDSMLLRVGSSPRLFNYQAMWQGDKKVQSAWGQWLLPGPMQVASIFPLQDYIYAVIFFPDGSLYRTFLGRFHMKNRIASPQFQQLSHVAHLDYLHIPTPEYNAGENKTYFFCQFPVMASQFVDHVRLIQVSGDDTGKAWTLTNPGPVVIYNGPTNYSFAITGDWSTEQYFIGCNYTQRFTFSEQFWYDGDRPVLNARTQIRNMAVNFKDTAYFGTEVKVLGVPLEVASVTPALTSSYTARTLGAEDFRLSRPQFRDGTYRFPVLGKSGEVSITLTNSEYTPSHFITAEWEGLVTTRTRR